MEAKQLEKLGLLESESRVYLALLSLGPSPAGKIAKETKLNRVSVYKALHKLIEIGLVSYVIKANRKEYEAADPSSINKLIAEKEQELEKLRGQLPSLRKLFETTKKAVGTNIYEGIKGAKTIWEELLKECKKGDEWLILGAPKSAAILGGYFRDFNVRRAKKGVRMKIIYNKNATELIKIRKKQPLTKVKVMPEEYITPASIEIVKNRALVVLYEPQILVFAINSKEVADSFRQYFNLLWKIANLVQ